MEMHGELRIPAPRQTVWERLNDPETLKGCIPGCQSVERVSDTEFTAKVIAKVGPVKATFAGKVTLSDLDPPAGYTITGEGSGGVAGFAKGSAKVALEEDGGETVLRYGVQGQIGGKLAQIGSRLVDAAANKVANDFFNAFNEKMTATHAVERHEEHHPEPVPRDPDLPQASEASLSFFAAGALVVFVVALITLL